MYSSESFTSDKLWYNNLFGKRKIGDLKIILEDEFWFYQFNVVDFKVVGEINGINYGLFFIICSLPL